MQRGGGRWVGVQLLVLVESSTACRAPAHSFFLLKDKGFPGMLNELRQVHTRSATTESVALGIERRRAPQHRTDDQVTVIGSLICFQVAVDFNLFSLPGFRSHD